MPAIAKKSTYNDREWIKKKGLKGLAQDAHVTSAKIADGKDAAPATNGWTPSGVKNKIVKALAGLATPVSKLIFDPHNARLHPEQNIEAVMQSLDRYSQRTPIVANRRTRHVEKGNGTLQAAKALGWDRIAVVWVDDDEVTAAGYGLADNKTAELAQWDWATVARLEKLMADAGEAAIGWTDAQIFMLRQQGLTLPTGTTQENFDALVSLSDRFIIPPFSVLDARQGYWQSRKRAWIALGIQSELGRGETPTTYHEHDGSGLATGLVAARARQKAANNGLLGFSEQARSHYKKPNATPGGSPLEAAKRGADGKTIRGDGRGRPLAATEGSGKPGDLAAGFKARVAHPIPSGGTGNNSAYMFKTAAGDSPLKDIQADEKALTDQGAENLYGAYGRDDDTSRRIAAAQPQSGTSIFDPVLCELVYSWFCPLKGAIFDPFAGGSVRGIVAAKLGRKYTGIDLRPEQAAANEVQADRITPSNKPRWVVGDAADTGALALRGTIDTGYDLVFSCPPYADLERYSDDPRDLSTMDYADFCGAYAKIIVDSCALLKDDRFACFVVGDVRDKRGIYRNFPGDTVDAFQAAGLRLYNDAILVTAVGSLPIRVGKQFAGARKLGKTHQNVLIFVKGDPVKAAKACGNVEVWLPEEPDAGSSDETA